MEKFCQSCGMPLTKENLAAGSKMYCNMCYENGKFIEPDITLEEMKARGIKGIEDGNDGVIKKFFIKASYPMMLKKLKRWN
ncbi:hypothetical protein RD055328_04020 [Companilactobacillus sp. RD055328]|uniref:zinc ribbon domain-containing protein n=1 Tax=Companilactobacillus sp. RD055328 TaxID=2916634 RepID=UPI001FC838C2|nr:zinc ribbon domain-containing protein [Companilactobacillus sp. RD055328]GKQ42479.1 hypothetical protein RD055328_04020 [Companilactobacillus sp. RD055328]